VHPARSEVDVASVVDMGRDAVIVGLGELGHLEPIDVEDRARALATMAAWREGEARRARRRILGTAALALAASALLAWMVVPQIGALGVEVDDDALLVQQGREQGAREAELATEARAKAEAPREPKAAEPIVVPEVVAPQVVAPQVVAPPESARPRPPKPTPRPTPSAGELLAAGRDLAARGKLSLAASTYETLIATYPDASESRAAYVSLGRVQASRGKHFAAVAMFGKYLAAGGGALAEEAHYGKIGSLHALGRTADRDQAIDALASAHPRSVYLSKARALAGR